MARSIHSSNLPVPLRRQLDLTTAVARKRLMEVHFQQAMELLEHVEGEMEPRRALDIYARLHKLTSMEAANLSQEVFVALGRRLLPRPIEVTEDADSKREVRWEDPDSTLRHIRRRLRGRVNLELRKWVEFHTGRTETAIFWAHVENAHEFADLLEHHRSIADAVALYAEQVGLSPSWKELVYFMVLDQRSSPSRPAGLSPTALARRAWSGGETRSTALRVVEKRRERGRPRAG
ncbi:MAG TPA: hypothetical protein VF167_08945 [Longimicrobiaceae bacterium]